jgi:hypothetical protein
VLAQSANSTTYFTNQASRSSLLTPPSGRQSSARAPPRWIKTDDSSTAHLHRLITFFHPFGRAALVILFYRSPHSNWKCGVRGFAPRFAIHAAPGATM